MLEISASISIFGKASLIKFGVAAGIIYFVCARAHVSPCGGCKHFNAPLMKLFVQPLGAQDKVGILENNYQEHTA